MSTPISSPLLDPRWTPRVTVAAIVDDGGQPPRYLLVEERTAQGLRLNNPAGHLEPGESPEQGVVREALEETARVFTPQALLGVYLTRFAQAEAAHDITYLRVAFSGRVGEPVPGRALDRGILRTLWLTVPELRACAAQHRSPLVLRCIEDHLAGQCHPLALVNTDASVTAPR